MPAQSTISILESIKKKLQKFDEPSQKQETFADVKDEFEYISQSQAQSANQNKNSDDIYGNNDQGNDLNQGFDDESSSNSANDQLNQNLSSEENSLPDFDATFSSEETNFNSGQEAVSSEVTVDETHSNQFQNNPFDVNKNNSTENLNEIDPSLQDLDGQEQNEENFEVDNSLDIKADNISKDIQGDLHEDEFSYEEETVFQDSNSQEGNRFEVSRLIDDDTIQDAEGDENDHDFSHLEDENFDTKEHFVEEKKLNNISDKNSGLEIGSLEFVAKNNFEEVKSVENKISLDLDNIALKAKNIEALELQNNNNQKNLSTKAESDIMLEFEKEPDIQDVAINKTINEKAIEVGKIFKDSSTSYMSKEANVESLVSNDLAKKTAQSINKLIGAKNTVNNVNKFANGEHFSEIAAKLMLPKIEKWLEDNLPEIVERAVEKEIARIIEKSEI